MATTKYKVLEFFAGAGGLALGLEQAGFKTVGLIEIDKNCINTLFKNRPDWNLIHSDIIDLVGNNLDIYIKKFKNIDLISGGFPCQPFSYAGKKKGFNDTRGTIFYYFVEVIRKIRPKMFLIENVKGLLTHNDKKTFQTIIETLQKLDYHLSWQVLNALDYGIAQKRERLFIVGIDSCYSSQPFIFPPKYSKKLTLKDVLKNVPKSLGASYSDKKKKIFSLVPPGGCWKNLPTDIAKEYMGKSYFLGGGKTGIARRLSWNEPSLTLTCSPSQNQTERCHPDEIRPFTIREYARIQGFPDTWEFSGSIHSIYKQIGNAVPVNLAKSVGLKIIDHLNLINKRVWDTNNKDLI
ncbi:MAG: DNA cytosine methyltransferase [Mycoplasma sp.]|nr:DNA cytosine methyltransferase [Mycoplasma sp.]